MADTEVPSRRSTRSTTAAENKSLNPDQVRRIEENRLKAKALREEYLKKQSNSGNAFAQDPGGFIPMNTAAGQKRPANAISTTQFTQQTTATSRDAGPQQSPAKAGEPTKIEPARKFRKYIDHDLAAMKDTKGGFLSREDDPFNRAMRWDDLDDGGEKKPAHMSEKEWERLRLLRDLQRRKAGPYEPGLSVLNQGAAAEVMVSDKHKEERKRCRECKSLEFDFVWDEVFKIQVCRACQEKYPQKYSLLTKTEVKDDYLLTDEECRDEELLPHLTKPNPREKRWHDMWLFLRCQVEAYALGPKRWGSADALDAEFERRQAQTKERKEKKFKKGLLELKRKTRGEQYRRAVKGEGPRGFGEKVGGGRHEHEWGLPVTRPDGASVKTCAECGMEVEELEF